MDPSPPSAALVRYQDFLAEDNLMLPINSSSEVNHTLEESYPVNLNLSIGQLASNDLSHMHGGYILEANDNGEGPSSGLGRAPEGANRQLLLGEISGSAPQVESPQQQAVAMQQTGGNLYVSSSIGNPQNVNHLGPLGLMVDVGAAPSVHQPSTSGTTGIAAGLSTNFDLYMADLVAEYQRDVEFRSFLYQHGILLVNQANWSTINSRVLSLTPTISFPFDHFSSLGFVVRQYPAMQPLEWQPVLCWNGVTVLRAVAPPISALLQQEIIVNNLNSLVPFEVVAGGLAHLPMNISNGPNFFDQASSSFQNGSSWLVHPPFFPNHGPQGFMEVQYVQSTPQIVNQTVALWQGSSTTGPEPLGAGSFIYNTNMQLGGHPELPVQPLTDSYISSLMMSHASMPQDFMMMLGHPVWMNGVPPQVPVSNTLQDMLVDVDNMTYEEMSALEDQLGYVDIGLPEEVILGHLVKEVHRSAGSSTEDGPCCICLEEYVDGEDITWLNCRHEFHFNCIKNWLVQKNVCPLCKKKAISF